MRNPNQYWVDVVVDALGDANMSATKEQIDIIASWIDGAHDNYGMYSGEECIPNPLKLENERLVNALKKEKDKIHCKMCNGVGRITSPGPYHSSNMECFKCNGEGKYIP